MSQVTKGVLIYYDLLTSLKTTQEVANFTSEIDTFLSVLFKSEKALINDALNSISVNLASQINQTFSKNNLDINNKDTVIHFFETLKELTKKFKVISLVLAFDPTYKTIKRIHNFIKETIGIGYILDIEVSEDALGGAIVMFNGKYLDFTLNRRVKDVFETRKEEIFKLIQ